MQQRKDYAANYFKIGKRQYEKIQLEVAKENLKLALRYDPEHREAADLLEKVQGLLGERPDRVRTFYKWADQERKVKMQQRLMEIENLIADGEKLNTKGEYRAAADKFEAALVLIRTMPYHTDMSVHTKRARAGLSAAEREN